MPASEDFGTLPANFKVLAPSPSLGGFTAVVTVHVQYAPQTVFSTLA